MTEHSPVVATQSHLLGRLVYGVCIAALCAVVLLSSLRHDNMNGDPRFTFPKMMDGSADRPYVYRALMPMLIVATVQFLPATEEQTSQTIAVLPVYPFFDLFNAPSGHAREVAAALLYMWLFLLLFALTLQKLFDHLFSAPRWLSLAIPVLGLLGIYQLSWQGQLYDFPLLALYTLAYDALFRRRWLLYLAAFTAACLCKETAAFLIVTSALWLFRDTAFPSHRFWRFLGLQGAIFVVIRLTVTLLYANNPGSSIEFNLGQNLALYTSPVHMFRTLIMLLLFLFLFLVIRYRYREQPRFLKTCMLTTIPLVVLFIFFGAAFEVRIFYEVYPIATLMVVYRLASILGSKIAVRAEA